MINGTRNEVKYGLENMKHHANSRLVPPGSSGWTLGVHVFTRRGVSQRLIDHEAIHVWQYARDGVPKFLVLYLWDYFRNLMKFRHHRTAYLNIRYEIEVDKLL